MQTLPRFISWFLVLAALLVAPAVHAEYFVIKNFQVKVQVNNTSTFTVEEIIDVEFSEPRHGIFRTIPYKYLIDGETVKIKIHGVSVENFPFSKEWNGNNLSIRIGDADKYVEGAQRYIIRYEVKDAFLFLPEHTEFYWNLIGTEWPVPIEHVAYSVAVAGNVTLADSYYLYTGASGMQGQDATVALQGNTLSGESTRTLNPGEGITLAIKLPIDYIRRPTATELFLHKYGLLALPIGLLTLLFNLWGRHGRDESVVEMAEYYPPEGISPAEAGAFIDDTTDNRDLLSLIPYWGGEGLLEMSEKQEKVLLVFNHTDYEFHKKKDLPSHRPDFERTIFHGLFRSGDTVELGDLKNSFYITMNTARIQLTKAVRNHELYTPQSRKLFNWLPVGAALCLLSIIPLFLIDQPLAALGMLITGVVGFIMRRPMLKKSKEGLELYRKLIGFREFINRAEKPRLERLLQDDPNYFEKTLPYAIAFGLTKKWTTKFDGLFTEPPSWYHGSYVGSRSLTDSGFTSFASNFESSMKEVQSAFTSQPSSSGGSGGGSSGGGFGGGGGGSW